MEEVNHSQLLEALCTNQKIRLCLDKYEVLCKTGDSMYGFLNFGDVDVLEEEEYFNQKVEMSLMCFGNDTALERIEFCSSDIDHSIPFVIDPIPSNAKLPLKITVRLNPIPLPLGFYSKWLVMKFCSIKKPNQFEYIQRQFMITRKVLVKVINSKDMKSLNVDAPSFIPNVLRSVFQRPIHYRMKLPNGIGIFGDMDFERIIPLYDTHLTHPNKKQKLKSPYASKYCKLMKMEEQQMYNDIKQYDLFYLKVTHHRFGGDDQFTELTFNVPGVSENRPALIRGDQILFRVSSCPNVEIETRVVNIKENEVRVVAPKYREVLLNGKIVTDEYLYESDSFHIRFGYNRFGLRLVFDSLFRLDYSLSQPNSLSNPHLENPFSRLLEPKYAAWDLSYNGEAAIHDLDWIHERINEYQMEAVLDVCNRRGNGDNVKIPYVIFGPPGTGKTLTVIECILQLSRIFPHRRILATAPSEAAADILAMRLFEVLKKQGNDNVNKLLRLNWPHRKPASVPISILSCCTQEYGQDIFKIPDRDTLLKHQIVVSTCVLTGVLRLRGIQRGDFDYLFIDEAAQALEPESFVPIDVVGSRATIVLAGDPCQLGASLRSEEAAKQGLSISFQERLMSLKAYKKSSIKNGYKNGNMTKLLNNYRSHEALLKLPSNLFYGDELIPCANPELTTSLCQWDMLPKKECTNGKSISTFPLLFYGVFGQDYHEIDSPSYCNPIEASQIADLISTLLSSPGMGVDSKHFGVITPFRAQVLTLRTILRSRNLGNINVGTVENFQGQESKIIFISTVLTHDPSTQLQSVRKNKNSNMKSMINDPKRFNVAITRAKALVVVIGHPIILRQDAYWRKLIEYCIENDAVRGRNAEAILTAMSSSDSDAMKNNILQEIQSLSLGSKQADSMYPDVDQYYRSDDCEWRIVL